MPRRLVIAALALPLLAIGLGIVRAELFLERASEFVFEIGGYDPRDVLRGRYLQFRLQIDPIPIREACDDTRSECCLCLTRVPGSATPKAERARCATARASCDAALHVRYVNEPLRYYVPERDASVLERQLLEAMQRGSAEVVLAVDESGAARVRALRADGRPIAENPP